MLALYGLVASGLPLPISFPPAGTPAAAKIAGKDRSRPFPCMDKPCGCDSAERCFTNCCCHTPAETLAWAKARGIEASVIDALTRRVAAAAPAAPSGDCCSPGKAARLAAMVHAADHDDVDEAICCDYQSLAAEPKQTRVQDACSSEPVEPPFDESPAPRVVTLRAMLACGGIVAQWAASGVSLPPPSIVTCDLPWPQVGVVTVDDARLLGVGGPPDLPPPRGG
jgi:hypothetical protein